MYSFHDTEFLSAKDKEKIIKQWKTFIKNGCLRQNFTSGIYNHLIQHCSFIAHYDINGFYSTYFEQSESKIRFFSQFDRSKGAESIEYGGMYWLNDQRYNDINTAMCDVIDEYKDKVYKEAINNIKERDISTGIRLLMMYHVTPEQYADLVIEQLKKG